MKAVVIGMLVAAGASVPSSPVRVPESTASAYVLPGDPVVLQQLSECADFVAVVELDRVLKPFNVYAGGLDAIHAAVYRLHRVLKGRLKSPFLPVHHLTSSSPYAERVIDDKTSLVGYQLDRKEFTAGRRFIVFVKSSCDPPRDDHPLRRTPRRFGESLESGALLLKKGYLIRFYQIAYNVGVYSWSQVDEERLAKLLAKPTGIGRPNPSCPFYRPGLPPCPPDVMEAESTR